MGISLAPTPQDEDRDPTRITTMPVPRPAGSRPPAGSIPLGGADSGLSVAPRSAPMTAPASAGGLSLAPPPMTAPSNIPAPTVAAPAAPVDRVKLATDTFANISAARRPEFDADVRDEIRSSAALGQVASGGLRTRVGNLSLARSRDLDAAQKDLSLKAAEGSIADATTAYQQALAGSQQALAERVANSQIGTTEGSLALERDKLALDEKLGLGGLSAEQRRVAIAEKEQAAQAAYRDGTLTLAERDAALRELAQAQQNAVATGQLDLAREAQGDQSEIARERLALDEKLGLAGLDAEARRTAIAERQQQAEAAYQAGQLTLGQRDAALRELAQAQQNEIASGQLELAQDTQTANQGNEAARLQLAREQLTQQGAQFGLSLAQQRDLAELADATQNRQLDISTAQGKNSLLLELARILGGTEGDLDPAFVQRIAQSLGFAMPGGATDIDINNVDTSEIDGSDTNGDDAAGSVPPIDPEQYDTAARQSPYYADAASMAGRILGTQPTPEQMLQLVTAWPNLQWDEMEALIRSWGGN